MKRICIVMILIFILTACSSGESSSVSRPTPPPTKAWYDGGTLHNATVSQWNSANNANRLATSSDWVTVMTGWDTLEEAREKAEDLKTCVTETATESPSEMKAADIAVACAVLMGWEPKE